MSLNNPPPPRAATNPFMRAITRLMPGNASEPGPTIPATPQAAAAPPAKTLPPGSLVPNTPRPPPPGPTVAARLATMPSTPPAAAPMRTMSGVFLPDFLQAASGGDGEMEWAQDIAREQEKEALLAEVRAAATLRMQREQPIDATLPPVSLKIHRLAGDPMSDVTAVSRLVAQDPPLAGRLMEMANSAYYQGATPARSLHDAVMRLGLGVVRNMVLLPSLKTRLLRGPKAEELWGHAVAVAAVSPFLAGLARLSPDVALVAGLLHDVGRILLWMEGESSPLGRRPGFAATADQLHAEVGAQLLERWRMDGEIVDAVRFHDAPGPASPRLSHLLCVADRFAHTLNPQPIPFDPLQHPSVAHLKLPVPPLKKLVERMPRLVEEMKL